MLPISVLVPTRNSMPLLPQHVESMRAWLDAVEEVIAVDSDSTDGTREFLQKNLSHSHFRLLTHPPGLYQSWNFGIAQCRAKYIYISTIGDSITRAGLEHLVHVAEQLRCDVVVSPPQMVKRGKPIKREWPVHQFIAAHKLRDPVVLAPFDCFVLALINLRKAILGSSASNLYRRDLLQRAPFPTDFGTAGDLGWILRHSAEISLGITPKVFSTFLFHPKAYAKSDYAVSDFAEKCLATARETMARQAQAATWDSASSEDIVEPLAAAWGEFLNARRVFQAAKRAQLFWIFSVANWRMYRARNQRLQNLRQKQNAAMTRLRTIAQSS